MASITTDTSGLYRGYDGNFVKIGAGILNPSIYKTPGYEQRKIEEINPSGGLATCIYSGFDTDPNPTILTIKHEFQYNTILGINIRYLDSTTRKAIFKFIIDSNAARIQSEQSIILDWQMLNRAFPSVIPFVTRRYKQQLLRINSQTDKGVVPLVEWPEMININSPFDGYYKKQKMD